jgi:hypothetical protein
MLNYLRSSFFRSLLVPLKHRSSEKAERNFFLEKIFQRRLFFFGLSFLAAVNDDDVLRC